MKDLPLLNDGVATIKKRCEETGSMFSSLSSDNKILAQKVQDLSAKFADFDSKFVTDFGARVLEIL